METTGELKVWSKEFFELMENFERAIKKSTYFRGKLIRIKKEDQLVVGDFYEGEANEYFMVYMLGYSYANGRNR